MTTVHSLPEREAKGVHQTIPTGQRAAAKAKAANSGPNKASSNTASDTISFEAAVRRGKALVADITKGDDALMRLGELADNVEQKYADRTLKKYADKVGIEYGTLKRCRTTYRQWVKIGAPAPQSYSAAQELAKHPDAAAIARNKPNITKNEARKLVQEYKQDNADNKSKGADYGDRKHYAGWLREVQNVATDAIRLAGFADQKLTPDNRRILLGVLESSLSEHVVQAGEKLAKLAAWLRAEEEEGKKEEALRSQPRRAA